MGLEIGKCGAYTHFVQRLQRLVASATRFFIRGENERRGCGSSRHRHLGSNLPAGNSSE